MENIKETNGTIGIASVETIQADQAWISCVNVYNRGAADMLVYIDNRTSTAVTVEPGDIASIPINGTSVTLVNTSSAVTLAYRVSLEFNVAGWK